MDCKCNVRVFRLLMGLFLPMPFIMNLMRMMERIDCSFTIILFSY